MGTVFKTAGIPVGRFFFFSCAFGVDSSSVFVLAAKRVKKMNVSCIKC